MPSSANSAGGANGATSSAGAASNHQQQQSLVGASNTGSTSNTTCAVCFDDFRNGDKLRTLICGHGVHIYINVVIYTVLVHYTTVLVTRNSLFLYNQIRVF